MRPTGDPIFALSPLSAPRNQVIRELLDGLILPKVKIFPCFQKNRLDVFLGSRFHVISDFFISEFDTNVRDRKLIGAWSIRGLKQYLLDWVYFHQAEILLADTKTHFLSWQKLFGRRHGSTYILPVLAEQAIYRPTSYQPHDGPLNVLFFGTFIPLHGIDKILSAIRLVKERNIEMTFTIIGKGQTEDHIESMLDQLALSNSINWVRSIVPEVELASHIAQSDIVLGIFGDSEKARSVVPNKVYQALACGRCVVTADSSAEREFFGDDALALTGPLAADIAATLIDLHKNRDRLARLAAGGNLAFERLRQKTRRSFRQMVTTVNNLPAEPRKADNPAVSVIVTTFRGGRFAPDFVAMMQNQTFNDWECVVIDDGSPDDTVDHWKQAIGVDSRFRLIGKPAEGNVGLARLFGIGQARCDLVAMIDQDDLVHHEYLRRMVNALSMHPEADAAISGHADVTDQTLPDLQASVPSCDPYILDQKAFLKRLSRGNFVSASAIVFRKEAIERIGGFGRHPDLLNAEDYYCILRWAHLASIVRVPDVLSYYRHHAGGKSKNPLKMVRGLEMVASMLEADGIDNWIIRRVRAQSLKSSALVLRMSHPTKAFQHAMQSLRLDPRPRAFALAAFTATVACLSRFRGNHDRHS